MTAAEARVLLVPSSDFLSETSDLYFKTALYCRRSMSKKQIYYSDKYTDDDFEYRHVVLPKQLAKLVPTSHLMTEEEWRGLGVQQSQGWMHYMVHKPEPHILLFRRPLPKDLKE